MHCPNTFALYRLLTVTSSWVNLLHHYTATTGIFLVEKPTVKYQLCLKEHFWNRMPGLQESSGKFFIFTSTIKVLECHSFKSVLIHVCLSIFSLPTSFSMCNWSMQKANQIILFFSNDVNFVSWWERCCQMQDTW